MKVTRIEQPPDKSRTTAQLGDLPNGTLFVRRCIGVLPLLKTDKREGTLVLCMRPDGIIVRFCRDETVRPIGHKPLEWWLIEERP